jgi:L-rhamnose mutarotase
MRILSFNEFLFEKEIPLSADLKEYTVNDLGEGKFSVEIDGTEKQFSVIPVPEDLGEYKEVFFELMKSLDAENPAKIYGVVKKIENMSYDFGNMLSTSLSLSNVKELSISLTDTQKSLMMASEEEFLKTEYDSLDRNIKNSILQYLKDLAQRYAIVLEALFYYTRTGDEKDFYEGMNFDGILQEYQKVIDKCSEKHGIVYDGPYADPKNNVSVDSPVDYAFWKAEEKKTGKKWILRATTSPEFLNSEENIIGKKGLNFTFLDQEEKEIAENFTSFPSYELEKRAEQFLKLEANK